MPVRTCDTEGKRWWAGGEISEKLTASYGERVTWIKNTNLWEKTEQAWRTEHMVSVTLEHASTCILFQDSYRTLRSFFWVWGDLFFWVHQTHPLTSLTWILGWPKVPREKEVGNIMLNDIIYLNPGKFQNLDQDGKVGIQTRWQGMRRWERFCILESFCILGILLYVRKVFLEVFKEMFGQTNGKTITGMWMCWILLGSCISSSSFFWQTWSCTMGLTRCWIVRLVWWFLQVLNFLESFCIWGSLLFRGELSV